MSDHPTELVCAHYHPTASEQPEATHWLIELDQTIPTPPRATGPFYNATPVCDECVPRVTMGDRPPEIIAIPSLTLVGNIEL